MSGVLHRVLVLGSGFTSGPLVQYLTRDGSVAVTVASIIEEQAQHLARTYQNTTAIKIDVQSYGALAGLIPGHDLVISFIPYNLHLLVAKHCIVHRVNMLTASYVSPALQALHQSACDVGVTLMNEIGLDPGIDHMLAVQCINEVHSKGGKVSSFQSWCGGLPAPECANNPLKYKFSWSPWAALMGTVHSAKYLKDGKIVEVPAGGRVMEIARPVDLYPDLELEGFPNRDSTTYVDVYGIPEAHTVLRGTLRYKGFCSVAIALRKLGLLSEENHQRLQPDAASLRWRDLLAMLISQTDIHQPDLTSSVYEAVGRDDIIMEAIKELHLLSDDPVDLAGTPMDALCSHLLDRLQFSPGERDAIFLHHTVDIEWPDSSKETRHIDLTMYGTPNGFTAMAQTVGKPAGIVAKMILNGEITKKGVVTPTTSDIYTPVLEKLKMEGIEASITTQGL